MFKMVNEIIFERARWGSLVSELRQIKLPLGCETIDCGSIVATLRLYIAIPTPVQHK